MKKSFIVGAVLVILVVIVSGCGSKSVSEKIVEDQIEQAMGGNTQVDLSGNSVNIKTEDGSSFHVGDNAAIPEDFPADVHVIDGRVVSVMKNAVGSGYQVAIETSKKIDEVRSEYESEMKNDGWSAQPSFDMGEMVMLAGAKDSRTMNVTVSADTSDETKNMVILVVSGV